jgi:cellulose synthase/poly-beta-1,6-N-acetylglucosamine synthase-like glycosyltransferase
VSPFMSWFGPLFAVSFISAHLAMMAGLLMERSRERKTLARLSSPLGAGRSSKGNNATPSQAASVSIVIPAKNEQANLAALFESLQAQEYAGPLEVVLIDDRSSDATLRMFQDFQASSTFPVKILHLDENPGPNFKQKALERGMDLATGEYLLFTDADCTMSPGWVATMSALLGDGRTALAIGPVYKRIDGPGFFRLFQAFDHAVRYMYLTGGAGLGVPCGGFGNNLIIRKTTLDAIGGYSAVPYSVTEDAALISCVRSRKEFRIRAGMTESSRVVTTPVPSWRELVTQGLRWNNGGLYAPDLETRLVFGALALSISAGVLAVPFVPAIPGLWMLPAAVLVAMTMNTIATVGMAGRMLSASWPRLAAQLVYMPINFTLLTLLGLLGKKVSWKGERLAGNTTPA